MSSHQGTAKQDDWDGHWAAYSEASDYSPAVAYRRRVIRRLLGIGRQHKGVRLLEIGSGTGQFANEFCPRFPQVDFLGLDVSPEGVRQAKQRTPSARFAVCDLLRTVTTEEVLSFRATHALCSEVLEHVDDPVSLLKNSGSGMAPGCRLVVTVPGGPMNAFDRHIGHRKHFTAGELRAVLTSAGFTVEKATGTGFPFFNLYRLALLSRGEGLVKMVSGPPSLLIKTSYHAFNTLGYLNMNNWGWQVAAVANWQGH